MSDNTDKKIIIAIDGYSSCGKSTVAKEIAKKLGYIFIDSGAMYRAVTLYCLRNKLVINGEINLPALLKKTGLNPYHICLQSDYPAQRRVFEWREC